MFFFITFLRGKFCGGPFHLKCPVSSFAKIKSPRETFPLQNYLLVKSHLEGCGTSIVLENAVLLEKLVIGKR